LQPENVAWGGRGAAAPLFLTNLYLAGILAPTILMFRF